MHQCLQEKGGEVGRACMSSQQGPSSLVDLDVIGLTPAPFKLGKQVSEVCVELGPWSRVQPFS